MRPNECTLMKLSINHHALEAGHQPADTHTNRDVYLNTDGVSENRLFIKYISRNLLILLLILFSKMNYQGNACESVSVCAHVSVPEFVNASVLFLSEKILSLLEIPLES